MTAKLRAILVWEVSDEDLETMLTDGCEAAFPMPEDVVDLHNRIQAARYSADTAADQKAMVNAARRLLSARV